MAKVKENLNDNFTKIESAEEAFVSMAYSFRAIADSVYRIAFGDANYASFPRAFDEHAAAALQLADAVNKIGDGINELADRVDNGLYVVCTDKATESNPEMEAYPYE